MRDKLLKLPKEKLVDALLELAQSNDRTADLVERMASSSARNLSRFERKLADLRKQNRYHDWRTVRSFAHEVRDMLADLRTANPEPREGVRLVAKLYEADEYIFNSGDDSSGDLGDIFRYSALELFSEFAARCDDKEWVINLVLELNQNDAYGVRDALIHSAEKYLHKDSLRQMADRLIDLGTEGAAGRLLWQSAVESLAAQMKDAALFEKMRIARGNQGPATCLDIARVHYESGNAKAALEWVNRVSPSETFQASERDALLLKVYDELGNTVAREEVAWRNFRRHRGELSFQTLLDVIGDEQSEAVIEQSVEEIMADKTLQGAHAKFLIFAKRLDDAETYLMLRKDQLNGDFYTSLLEYAAAMEDDQRFYAASIIYRELADSILRRGVAKYYHHGARYLKKLEQLAPKVVDWRDSLDHTTYFAAVKQEHFRKKSFWSQFI